MNLSDYTIEQLEEEINSRERRADLGTLLDRNVIVKIEGKSFRCPCGCNVFGKYDSGLFECNSCNERYESD